MLADPRQTVPNLSRALAYDPAPPPMSASYRSAVDGEVEGRHSIAQAQHWAPVERCWNMSASSETASTEPTLQLVTCSRGHRPVPMSVKPGQLERLLAGDIPCPACNSACKPSAVRVIVPDPGVLVPAWDEEAAQWCEVYHYVQYLLKPEHEARAEGCTETPVDAG